MNSTSIWHLLDKEMGMNCKTGFQEYTVILCDLWNFTATLELCVKTICQRSLDTPKETCEGKRDSIGGGAHLHKRRGVAEPQFFWFTSRLSQSSELHDLKRMVQTQEPPRTHHYFYNLLHLNSDARGKKEKEEKTGRAHRSASWGVLWGRPSVGRHSCRRDIWTVSPQSATWCASVDSPSG